MFFKIVSLRIKLKFKHSKVHWKQNRPLNNLAWTAKAYTRLMFTKRPGMISFGLTDHKWPACQVAHHCANTNCGRQQEHPLLATGGNWLLNCTFAGRARSKVLLLWCHTVTCASIWYPLNRLYTNVPTSWKPDVVKEILTFGFESINLVVQLLFQMMTNCCWLTCSPTSCSTFADSRMGSTLIA